MTRKHIIFSGEQVPYSADEKSLQIAAMFNYIKNMNGMVAIGCYSHYSKNTARRPHPSGKSTHFQDKSSRPCGRISGDRRIIGTMRRT